MVSPHSGLAGVYNLYGQSRTRLDLKTRNVCRIFYVLVGVYDSPVQGLLNQRFLTLRASLQARCQVDLSGWGKVVLPSYLNINIS